MAFPEIKHSSLRLEGDDMSNTMTAKAVDGCSIGIGD